MKSVKSFLKNRKGSALAITAVMMVVLALLVSVLLTCASYALNHAYAMYARQQAYFSARSAVLQFKSFVEAGETVETNDGPKIKPYTNFNAIVGRTITATVGGSTGNVDPHFGEVKITLRKVDSAVHSANGNQKYKVTAVGTYNLGDKSYQNAASVYIFDDYKVEFKGNRNMVSSSAGLNPNPNGTKLNIISLDYDKTLSREERDDDTMTHMYSPTSFTYSGESNSNLDGYVLGGDVSKGVNFGSNIQNAITVRLSKGSGNASMPTMLGAYVNGNITFVQGGVYVDGDVYCSGDLSVDGGQGFTVTGNLYVGGNCTFTSNFKVGGSLFVGGAFRCSNGCSVGSMGSGATLFVAGSATVNNDFMLNGVTTTGDALNQYIQKGPEEFASVQAHMTTIITEKIQAASSSYKVNKDKCDEEYQNLQPLKFKYDASAKCIYIDESGKYTADYEDGYTRNIKVENLNDGNHLEGLFSQYSDSTLVVDTGYSGNGTQKTIVIYVDDGVMLNLVNAEDRYNMKKNFINNIGVIGDGQLIIVLGKDAQLFGGIASAGNYNDYRKIAYLSKAGSGKYKDYYGRNEYPYEIAMTRAQLDPNANLASSNSYVKMDSLYNSIVGDSTDKQFRKDALKQIEPQIYILSPYPVSDPTRVKGYLDQLSRAQNAGDGAQVIDPLGHCSNIFMQGMIYSGYIVTSDHVAMENAQKIGENPLTAMGDSSTAIRSVDIYGCVFTDHFVYVASGDANYTFIPADSKFKDNLMTPKWVISSGSDDDSKPDYENKKLPIAQSEFVKSGSTTKVVNPRSVSNKSTYNNVSSAFYAY